MTARFHTQSGILYLGTAEISPALADALLDLFANEGAVDLVADLTRVRREGRTWTLAQPMTEEVG